MGCPDVCCVCPGEELLFVELGENPLNRGWRRALLPGVCKGLPLAGACSAGWCLRVVFLVHPLAMCSELRHFSESFP